MADRATAMGREAPAEEPAAGETPARAPAAEPRAAAETPSPEPGPFERDTAVELLARGGEHSSFAADVAEGWRAGRGPHGGYLAAMILRALTEALADERRYPRSLTIHFLRPPEPGPVRIDADIERAGRSLSTLTARMEQEGRVMALALAAFSLPWRGPEFSETAMPAVAPPTSSRTPGTLIPPELGGPQFARNITLQPRFGARSFGDEDELRMESGGWIGLVEPRALDALALAFFTDALIPAPFMRTRRAAPAPTIDITIHFRSALPPQPAQPIQPAQPPSTELVLARSRARLVHEGFFEEDATIWAADGMLLAQSRQLALLLE